MNILDKVDKHVVVVMNWLNDANSVSVDEHDSNERSAMTLTYPLQLSLVPLLVLPHALLVPLGILATLKNVSIIILNQ